MDALVYTAPLRVEMRDLPEPEPGPDEVIVRTSACGICGSDVHGFQGRSRIRVPPMVMGHEFGGRIVAIGAGVEGLERGQRVVAQPVVGCGQCPYCRNGRANICPRRELIGGHRQGAFADLVRVPARQVYPVSDALSDVAGTLVEPLGNGVHMLRLAGGVLDRDVVVFGAGTLGLLAVALARFGGAHSIIAADVDPRRLAVARRLGADDVVDARDQGLVERISQRTGGGAEVVIDAAGYTPARRQAIAVTAAGGTVVLLGLSDPESELPILDIINREIAVRGSYASSDDDFRHAISILESGKIDTDSWVTTGRLDRGQEYFEALASHQSESIKVVFEL